MKIVKATESDVLDLYRLQLLTFESEAEMIGSRMVPALMESEEEFKATFTQWHTYKLVDDGGRIIGGIRYQYDDGVVEVGRLMVHPNYRQQGLARKLLVFVDEQCSQDRRVLYTCTKSWINIMKRDYPLYIWRNNNSNGMGGFNVLDNIVTFYIFFTVVGFLAAMLGTIIGAGGGLVFVPLFMYWFPEWSPSMVVGTSLFSVMCNAISGSIAYLKQKKVYINAAIIFSLATFPGAILGAQMSGWFSGKGFMFAFGCFMLCASVLIGFKNFRKGERKEESLTLEQLSYSKPIGISISFFVGFISSIFGIGGGLIHVPALIYLMGFPTHMATATSQSILAVSTTVGVITHLIESHIIFSIAIPTSIGAIFGAQVGARIAKRLKAKAILALMSIAVFALAVRLILKSGILG